MIAEIQEAIRDAVSVVSRVYGEQLDPEPTRLEAICHAIGKHARTLRRTPENLAALTAYVILKNEPLVLSGENFNGHVALVAALSLLGRAVTDPEGIEAAAANAMGRLRYLDLSEARATLDAWRLQFPC